MKTNTGRTTLSGSNFVKTSSEDWELSMKAMMEPAMDFRTDVQEEMFDGDGLVPLVIADRDAATGPLRYAANAKKARIQQNPALSDGQRRNALEMLCQQTEAEMRLALGDRNFHAFKAFNQWWFRELSVVDQVL